LAVRSILSAVIAKGDLTKGETMNVRTKIIGTVVVAASLVVPVAQAQRPDDRAGVHGPGLVAAQQQQPSAAIRPDDRAGVRGTGAAPSTIVFSTSSNGFDWSDALIGGAGGMGAALLLTGCTFLVLSQRNRARAT
jgi:hypothetical protein